METCFFGNKNVSNTAKTIPVPQEVMFPATALVVSPVVATVIEPERFHVVTNQAVRPQQRAIHGAKTAATVDMRLQSKINPTGTEAPPTIIASTVSSQVKSSPTSLRMQQKAARTSAYRMIPKWLICTSFADDDSGRKYVLYTSKVSKEETAISSADVELVTAMKSNMSISTAPPLPARAMAVAGDDSPAPFCAVDNGSGYVGNRGLPVKAAHPRPIALANPNGMPYQAIPPNMYALTDVSGLDEMARCQ